MLKDYERYVIDNKKSRQFLNEVFTHTYGEEYREEKIANYLLATMSNFLEDKETDVDSYLTTQKGYYGDFSMDGMDMEVLSLYDFDLIDTL